jgi:hypothetical protein
MFNPLAGYPIILPKCHDCMSTEHMTAGILGITETLLIYIQRVSKEISECFDQDM